MKKSLVNIILFTALATVGLNCGSLDPKENSKKPEYSNGSSGNNNTGNNGSNTGNNEDNTSGAKYGTWNFDAPTEKAIDDSNFEIVDGPSPPNIEGKYHVTGKFTDVFENYKSGIDSIFEFYNQQGANVQMKENQGSGRGNIIKGLGDNFTLNGTFKIDVDGCIQENSMLITGRKTFHNNLDTKGLQVLTGLSGDCEDYPTEAWATSEAYFEKIDSKSNIYKSMSLLIKPFPKNYNQHHQ